MNLPFTFDQFINVFSDYNAAIWPTQIVAYVLGVVTVLLALRPNRASGKVIACVLATFWAFTGIAYHLLSFAPINPAARIFATVFVVEAALLLHAGLRGSLRFRFVGDLRSRAGLALMLWAMIGYPLVGFALGHGFPDGPVFGLTPCPLVIFTFGLFLLAEKTPRYVVMPPIVWALVGTSAAVTLGIREDLSLMAAAVIWTAFAVGARVAMRRATCADRIADASGETAHTAVDVTRQTAHVAVDAAR
jgi:hypothetical protein